MKEPIERIGNASLDLVDSANERLEDWFGLFWYLAKLFIIVAAFVWLMNGGRLPEGKVQSDYCPDGGWACVRE